jgi:hypothetical protein
MVERRKGGETTHRVFVGILERPARGGLPSQWAHTTGLIRRAHGRTTRAGRMQLPDPVGTPFEPRQRPQLLGRADDPARERILSARTDFACHRRFGSADGLPIRGGTRGRHSAPERALSGTGGIAIHARPAAALRPRPGVIDLRRGTGLAAERVLAESSSLLIPSGPEFLEHTFAAEHGGTLRAAVVEIGQLQMIQAEQPQDGRMQIVNMGGSLHRPQSDFIG